MRQPQNFFFVTLTIFVGKPEYEIMQTAWRERTPSARIKAAKEAIVLNVECATAYILLAEEEVIYTFLNYVIP